MWNDEGKVVGYIFTGMCYYLGSDPFVEVIQLLVDKETRGQGIGKKLIEHVSEYYKNQGICEMKLHSRIERERAHSRRNILEDQQLNLLRKYSLVKIPQIYFVHKHNNEIPYEALIMEYIEGINASKLPTDHPNRNTFVNEVVENLIHLHSISNAEGFGTENEMFPDWRSYFGRRVKRLHEALHLDYKDRVSSYVMNVADKSYEAFDIIFAEPIVKSSLIHSDYNLWNILVDEKSAKINAVIDPIDAGWADKEIDLFHLQNADGDRFGLLERYRQNATLSELFPVKNAFYWFWDDVKHMVNMGWYQEERFSSFGKRLLTLMEEFIVN